MAARSIAAATRCIALQQEATVCPHVRRKWFRLSSVRLQSSVPTSSDSHPQQAASQPVPTNEQTAPASKPPTLGSSAIDHLTEHPWHFFGPLLALFIGWVARNNLSSNEQDDAVREIDGRSPLHPREVTILGRDNALTLAQYKAVVQEAFVLLRERQARLAPGQELLMRPSELHALIGRHHHKLGSAAPSAPSSASAPSSTSDAAPVWQPRHAYMLARVASWRAAVHGGQESPLGQGLPCPATLLSEGASNGAGAGAGAGAGREPVAMELSSLATHATASYRNSDEAMHPLTLLVLYTSCIGGRSEPIPPTPAPAPATPDAAAGLPASAAVAEDESGSASPSQRLALCVGLVRAWAALTTRDTTAASAAAAQGHMLSPDLFAAPYSIPELVAALDVLGDTHQLPTRQRLRPGPSAWPWKTYGVGAPLLLLAEGCRDGAVKVEEVARAQHRFDDGLVLNMALPPRTYSAIGLSAHSGSSSGRTPIRGRDLLQQGPSPSSSSSSSALPPLRDTAGKDISDLCAALRRHAGLAEGGPGQGREEDRGVAGGPVVLLDAAQARRAVLISRAVCAWGECYSVER